MKKIIQILFLFFTVIFLTSITYAEKYIGDTPKTKAVKHTKAELCKPATGSTDLDLNNVRARINTGGDMWWDFSKAQYEIPKGSRKTSSFACALWIGGLDVNKQLKLAAQRYRSNGVDYWTGPLTVNGTAAVDAETCTKWDRHYKITRSQVEDFIANRNSAGYTLPDVIEHWPWKGDQSKGQTNYLAPFFDFNGDYAYDPNDGDYPYYDFTNSLCPTNPDKLNPDGTYKPQEMTMETERGNGNPKVKGGILVDQVLKGDMTLWWVFNDKGNTHTETQGDPIGLEIRAQAFSFSTNDEINNMTFYTYEVINRSTYTLTETYFSQWCDFDLGYAFDDYTGCDVTRGLGYVYNGKAQDGSGEYFSYEGNPPAIGVDFFQGPYMDQDGFDNPKYSDTSHLNQICDVSINGVNFGNGIIDDERFGMRRFVYHNNSSGVNGDPSVAIEYYNMLKAIWKDNTHMVYGGTGYYNSPGALANVNADFMFPGNSDPLHWGTGCGPDPIPGKLWTEETMHNPPYDRRFMQSAGPFTLKPGAVNYITVGIPWAQAPTGGPFASVELLRIVDDKCQALFDNCFKVLDGPDAPDLVVKELDKELILLITNRKGSNNYKEQYKELDVRIPKTGIQSNIFYSSTISANGDTIVTYDSVASKTVNYDRYYHFEGYQIYQLSDANVSISDIQNNDKARLVAQCDIKNLDANGNAIAQLVNYSKADNLGGALVPTEMVNGKNNGIQHSFNVKYDLFATGDNRLVNHKKYYYIAIAYAYNNFKQFSLDVNYLDGQKEPYKAGRKSPSGEITKVIAIPHIPSPEKGGTVLNAAYGSSPKIKRIEGQGNGGLLLDLTQASINELMAKTAAPYIVENPIYENAKGPIDVKVVDPLNVKSGNFTLKFIKPDTNQTINITHYTDSISLMKWELSYIENGVTITQTSELPVQVANEQIFPDLGLSISVGQVEELAKAINSNTTTGNDVRDAGFIEASLTYADSTKQWLFGVPDIDASRTGFNWIRSGSTAVGANPTPEERKTEDYYYHGFDAHQQAANIYLDPSVQYGKILGGTWAPYRLSSVYENGPAFSPLNSSNVCSQDPINASLVKNSISNIASVDIVFTPDQSKWTRCPVIELSDDPVLVNNSTKFKLRSDYSINKEGNIDTTYDHSTGMSWFPGYAINIETGERLNIMFGEDSWQTANNGKDMMWNPTSTFTSGVNGNIVFGGKHFVYILGHNDNVLYPAASPNCPAYDGGQWIYNQLKTTSYGVVYSNVMWVGLPMVYSQYIFKNPKDMPTEAKIRLRVQKPYRRFYSAKTVGASGTVQNTNFPMYEFNTGDIATQRRVTDVAKTALDLIGVVPNPYYAFSKYEINQLDNRVRIINLPQKCTVTIYTINGTLIRQYKVDKEGVTSGNSSGEALTSIDWDLKNFANIPISGGVYIIHVNADGIGEKIVKWFGALRPTDLNSF